MSAVRPTLGNRLIAATDKVRGGAPGVTRKRLQTGDGVDANNGFVRGQRSGRDRAQGRPAMGEPQLAQLFCALFQPDEGCGRIDRGAGFRRP